MKQLTALIFLFGLLMAGSVFSYAQKKDAKNLEFNLNVLEMDLTKLDSDLQTYDDIAICEYSFQEAGNRLKTFAVIVTKDSPLYETYNKCSLLYYQLEKRIEDLRTEHDRKKEYDDLMNQLLNTINELSSLIVKGKYFVESNQQDSLIIAKGKANRIYLKAVGECEAKKQLVNSDYALQQLMDSIEEYNDEINALQCRDRKQLYDLGFRLIMVTMVLILVLNMLKSKLKAKKMAKQTQKQMNQLMGGDDTPVL